MRLYVKNTKHANFKKLWLGSSRRHEKTSSLNYVLIVRQRVWYTPFLLLAILFLQVTLEKATSAICKLLQTTEQYLRDSYIRLI